jgi:hypothetical protein
MSFITWLNRESGLPAAETSAHERQLAERLDDALVKIEDLEESLLEVADAFDNVGWSPMGFTEPQKVNEIPLKTVKAASEVARALDAVNPFVKRGVNARISYIWGNGVQFEKLDSSTEKALRHNRDSIFSQQAYEERERAAATDGNVFTALHTASHDSFRVPLAQIVGAISNPDNDEEIWYYKREWTTKRKGSSDTDEEKIETHTKYYPSLRYYQKLMDEGKNLPKRWGKYGVDQQYVIQHIAVNKQIGWRWGIPDIMPVIFWAKAYKEFLEDNLTLVKAYSRIAWQIKNSTTGGANAVSAQWTSTPTRDPITGEARSVGAALNTGQGTELVPTALNASEVKFDNGNPIAAAVAAGLEISLDVILSTSENSGAASTLDQPTLKAMETRQNLWTNAFLDLFEFWGDEDAKVTWRNISEDETHRRIQSVQLAYEGGTLFQDEARKEVLEMLRITPMHPDGEMPVSPAVQAAEIAAQNQQKIAETKSAVPSQGKSGSVGSINSGRGQVKEAVKKSMSNK